YPGEQRAGGSTEGSVISIAKIAEIAKDWQLKSESFLHSALARRWRMASISFLDLSSNSRERARVKRDLRTSSLGSFSMPLTPDSSRRDNFSGLSFRGTMSDRQSTIVRSLSRENRCPGK